MLCSEAQLAMPEVILLKTKEASLIYHLCFASD